MPCGGHKGIRMRSFSSSDLKRALSDVLTAAGQEPIIITRHNRPRYILMDIQHYEAGLGGGRRQAIATNEMPLAHLAMLETALEDMQRDG